jgi:aspartate kinase
MSSNIRVIKYGGSSLATADHIRFVAEQIIERKRPGEHLVIVASAMGDATDQLMSLAGEVSSDPPLRELDKILGTGEHVSTALLCMALRRLGHEAVSLTGPQGGIRTSDEHFNASVEDVDDRRIRKELADGRIVVVAGFQGQNTAGEITTLGRGGSDTTAVVLADALAAGRCEICSDVDGVYSADPRVVKDARRLDSISYVEMLEMARHGASVLDSRAVHHARGAGVEIYARSTFEPDAPGTLISELSTDEPRVVGIASHEALLSLAIDAAADRAAANAILEEVEPDDVFLDKTDAGTGRRNILIPSNRLADERSFTAGLHEEFEHQVVVGSPCSSVSAIGLGVGSDEDLQETSRRFSARVGVSPSDDFSGEHSITCLVQPDQAALLMNAFHREFDCPTEDAA